MIESLIRKLKNNPDYKWNSNYSSRDLLSVSCVRFAQLTRGMFLKMFLKRSDGLIFRGRDVSIYHPYQIIAGKNLILDDRVTINALSTNGISFGDNVSIGRDSILFCTGVIASKGTGIIIGHGTGISARAYFAGQGGITIGDNVIMGPGVQIFSENHNFDSLEKNIKDQGEKRLATSIGNNCWVGADCKIMAGVDIGEGCVLAAGCVVTKSFPSNVILAGVPARVIKTRGN